MHVLYADRTAPPAAPSASRGAGGTGAAEFESLRLAAAAGADWAWATLYRDLAPGVLGYLRARNASDPEDLLGEVFLQVVRDFGRFEGDRRSFRAWVFTIAHHRLLDDRRRRKRRPVDLRPGPVEAGAAPGADEQAIAEGSAARVRAIVAGLSPDQQSVLLLRILGDMTVEEVARAIRKRPGAVKALQRRGLAAVERDLARAGVTL